MPEPSPTNTTPQLIPPESKTTDDFQSVVDPNGLIDIDANKYIEIEFRIKPTRWAARVKYEFRLAQIPGYGAEVVKYNSDLIPLDIYRVYPVAMLVEAKVYQIISSEFTEGIHVSLRGVVING